MKILLIFSFILLSFSLMAKEITLANITSDSSDELTQFNVIINEANSIESFRIITSTHPEGPVERDQTFPVKNVMEGGVTLVEKKGRDILKLKSNGLTELEGGRIVLDYLYNGVNGTRKTLHLIVVKSGDSFIIHNEDGAHISKLRIIANRYPIIGRVGISDIQRSIE